MGSLMHLGPFTVDFEELQAKIAEMPRDRQIAIGVFLSLIPKMAVDKGQDYGSLQDTFRNYQQASEAFDEPGWHAPFRRLVEKVNRIANFVRRDLLMRFRGGEAPQFRYEGMLESIQDLAWLPCIGYAMWLRDQELPEKASGTG